MQHCEVCGRAFRALNLNHLRTHGIVSWDQYQETVNKRLKPDQTLIREVSHSLLHRQEVADRHQETLRQIAAGTQAQLPGIMAANKMRRVLRLTKLMESLEEVEGVMLDEGKYAGYTFEQLLDLAKYAAGDISKMIAELTGEMNKGRGFGSAVEQLVQNQYNLIQGGQSSTPYDSRLPEDPRAQIDLLRKVDEMLELVRSGRSPAPQGEVLEVVASNSSQP